VKVEVENLLKQEKDHTLKLEKMLQTEREDNKKKRDELDEMHKKLMLKLEEHDKELKMEKNTISNLTREIEKVKK
jgi:hypothetical protein